MQPESFEEASDDVDDISTESAPSLVFTASRVVASIMFSDHQRPRDDCYEGGINMVSVVKPHSAGSVVYAI